MTGFRHLIDVRESHKVVKVELNVLLSDVSLRLLNAFVEQALEDLKEEGVVRKYYNRIDRFVVVPEAGWEPVMVKLEIEQLLRLN
jgi:hypothetical protein